MKTVTRRVRAARSMADAERSGQAQTVLQRHVRAACRPLAGAVMSHVKWSTRWGCAGVWLVLALCTLLPAPARAVEAQLFRQLAGDDFDEKGAAVTALAQTPEAMTVPILRALQEGRLRIDNGGRAWIQTEHGALDAGTGEPTELPDPAPDEVMINNALRTQIASAIAAAGLLATDRDVRLDAARALASGEDRELRPLIAQALAAESDDQVRQATAMALAAIDLDADDPQLRLQSVQILAASDRAEMRTRLAALIERGPRGTDAAAEQAVLAAAGAAMADVSARLERAEWFGRVFAGISLGSILMLAAMGLAITYGLLGVINMAHGEMIMIGAYATYVTQAVFRAVCPSAFAWYPLAALPVAFLVSALVGMLVERTVIRWLYGRPLETLLATWGVSLVLIQSVRQIFGPQNVEIENPGWLSGGLQWGSLVLPYNRMAIIAFALAVLAVVAVTLARTRLGLFVRAVTQNRAMASAVGVATDRVDLLAFGLGSGVAGLAGVALAQIGNVGPELGQAYIIDSFIVVVLGGVGQLAGTVFAGFGLGVFNKFLEPWLGAVIAKIVILALIIAFIQKRPSGLFALKGRTVEA